MLIDLSHPILPGQLTHPGLPAPTWEPFRSRQEYREATGTEFQVDRVCMVGNTGTYLDSPYHRFADGKDLAAIPLSKVADLPIVLLDLTGAVDATETSDAGPPARLAVTAEMLSERLDGVVTGAAILLHTGGDRGWGTPAYAENAPFLTARGAEWLVDRVPALVGIDAVNIDDLGDLSRPAHTTLLGEGVLILEHLTGLSALPSEHARLHAAPPAWHEIGTWPVRAYAVVQHPA